MQRLAKARLNNKVLSSKILKLTKAISLVREGMQSEAKARLACYSDESSLTTRRKRELTAIVGNKQNYKNGKFKGAEVIFQGFIKALGAGHDALSSTLPARATSSNSHQEGDSSRSSALCPLSQKCTTYATALISSVQNNGRGRSRTPVSGNRSRPNNTTLAPLAASGDRDDGQRVSSSPDPCGNRSNGTDRGDTTPRQKNCSARGAEVETPPGTGLHPSELRVATHPRSESQPPASSAGTSSANCRVQSTLVNPPVRARRMLSSQGTENCDDTPLFDSAPTEEQCKQDPHLWGRYRASSVLQS